MRQTRQALLIVVFISLVMAASTPAFATWTVVQQFISPANCPAGTLTCTLTVTSTGSGHVIVLFLEINGVAAVATTISAAVDSAGSVYTLGSTFGCNVFISQHAADCAITLSSVAGATIVSVTRSNNTGAPQYKIGGIELAFTNGPPVIDVVGTRTDSVGSGTHVGVTLTPTGANDVILQAAVTGPSLSSITSPYTGQFSDHFGIAYSLNTVDGTAPTWTETSPQTGVAALTAIAIRESTVTSYPLTVTVSGNGTVTSSPAGISCPVTCVANFAPATSVTLTETPAATTFSGWTGDCSSSGTNPTCNLTLSAAHAATATFIGPLPAFPTFIDNNELTCGFTSQCRSDSPASTTPYVFSPVYEYVLGASSWVGPTPPGSFSLPYATTFAGACSALTAMEASRSIPTTGVFILDWPPGAYPTSSSCIIPQTNTSSTHATSPIIIRTSTYAPLETMPEPIGAGGIQANVGPYPSVTQIGLRNPSLDGKNLLGLSVECPTQSAASGGLAYQLGMQTFCIPSGNFSLASGLNPFAGAIGVPGCPTGAAQPNTACYNYLQFLVQVQESGTAAPFITCSVGAGTSSADTCNSVASGGSGSLPNFGPDLWYWEGIVFSPSVGNNSNLDMFKIQDNQGTTTSTSQWASHFHFRRVGVMGDWTSLAAGSNQFATGISMGQCTYCSIVGSSFTQMLRPGGEGHVVSYNGVLAKISNNVMEGQSSCAFSGGAGVAPAITPIGSFVSATDFEFRRTRCTFPVAWLGSPYGPANGAQLPDSNVYWGGAGDNPAMPTMVNVDATGLTITYVSGPQFHDSTSFWPSNNVFLGGATNGCWDSGSSKAVKCSLVNAGSWPQTCGSFCYPSNPPTQLLLSKPVCNSFVTCTGGTSASISNIGFILNGASILRKNAQETKSTLRTVFSGNIFENVDPSGGQRGINFILSNRNVGGGPNGSNYQNTHQDDNIQDNVFQNSCEDVSIGVTSNYSGGNGGGVSTAAQHVVWSNNAHLNITTQNPGCSTIGTSFGQQINVPFQTWTGTATSDGTHMTFGSSLGTVTSVDAGAPVVSDTATYNSFAAGNPPLLTINVTASDFNTSETVHFTCSACAGYSGVAELDNGDFPVTAVGGSTITVSLPTGSSDPVSFAAGTKVQGPTGAQIFDIPTGSPVFLSGCTPTSFNTPTGTIGPLATTGSTLWNGAWTTANTTVVFLTSVAAGSATCTISNVQGKPNGFYSTHDTFITDVPSVLGTGNGPSGGGTPFGVNAAIQDDLMLNAGTAPGTAGWFNSSASLGEGNVVEAFQFDTSTLTASNLVIPRPFGAKSLYAEYCNNSTVSLLNCTPAGSNPPHMYFPCSNGTNCTTGGTYASCAVGFVYLCTGLIPLNLPDMHSYALAPTSPYFTLSSSGGPLGADFSSIDAAETANTYICKLLGAVVPCTTNNPFPDSLVSSPAPTSPTAPAAKAFASLERHTLQEGGTQ